jgi:predicted membrane-bound dolichyl-phosphate-mannose-protein mannosyltransferase
MSKEEQQKLLIKIAEESFYEVSKYSKTLFNNNLADDLAQDTLISIMTYPNDKMIDAYAKGEHLFLIKRIMRTQAQSKTSTFYYTYRKNEDDINIDDLKDKI